MHEALGRSRGGFTTKIHAVVSGRGCLLRFALTGGEAHDINQAPALVRGLSGWAVVDDRADDSDAFIACVKAQDMAAVIPSRSHRKLPRPLDTVRYAIRNVERLFGHLKAFRFVATRYDKTLALVSSLVDLSGGTT